MTATLPKRPKLIEDETQSLLMWAESIQRSEATYFEKAQKLARRLGAHYRADRLTEVGFWTPDLTGDIIQAANRVVLEIYSPIGEIDFRAEEQQIHFERIRVPLVKQGEFVWGVIEGMRPGRRNRAGSFYWLRHTDQDGHVHIIRDPLAYSLPYGVFGPAELYDMRHLQRHRADRAYFRQTGADYNSSDIPRMPAPTNILQLHVNTASTPGTIEGLTDIFERISNKLATNIPLEPEEAVYAGYDAIQLLPVEPTIEYRREENHREYEFFALVASEDDEIDPRDPLPPPADRGDSQMREATSEEDDDIDRTAASINVAKKVSAVLRKPNTQNWGYDVPILGSGTTNPAVLGSLRPDEIIDFIAVLHNFSQGPIQLIYDLVYGHADNQALELMIHQFFKGPNMYGQDLNHQLPQVRAILLEMQRRKINTGADGIRVDGGQDFRFFNPLTDRVEQDDAYLLAMSDVVQEIDGHRRLMFTVFEDGRPWPQEGWEEISRYRELIEQKPESFQWGPLIFAHNTPSLEGFWDRKWRRVGEVIFQGDHWITGCGNHDTVRRGTQVDTDKPINWRLGKTLPEVLHKAYNNPATQLWVCGFSPGLPMDFINANIGSPWGFFRNTDDQYGVKVVSEEISFLDWQIEPEMYDLPEVFPRLKQLGFQKFSQVRNFSRALQNAMVATDYNLQEVSKICRQCVDEETEACSLPNLEKLDESTLTGFLEDLNVRKLKQFAMAFMEDGHDLCNVSRYYDRLDPDITYFHLALREYRRRHSWLQKNLTGHDRFNRISDDVRTVFYGLRSHSEEERTRRIAFVAHMGGAPLKVRLEEWLDIDLGEWKLALATPDLAEGSFNNLEDLELHDSQGILLEQIV